MLNSPQLTNLALLVARILFSIIFLWSGFGKAMGFAASVDQLAKLGVPLPMIVSLLVVALQIVGGLMILVGYGIKPAALALGVFSIAAAILVHFDLSDRNQTIHFLKNLAIAGGFLALAVTGAGAYSIGNRRTS